MDDDARLFHRLPLGSRCRRPHRRLHRPALDSIEIYRIAGRPVYLPHLIIGLGLTALLTTLNYRGIRLSATFQNWTSFGTLALFIVFIALGASKGCPRNFRRSSPRPAGFVSAHDSNRSLLYDRIRIVSKAAEESTPEFRSQSFLKAIWMAILVGILFYTIVIAAVAFAAPWHNLTGEKFMTGGRLSTRSRLALDRQRNPRRRASVAFQVLQWKFRRLQPPAFCSGTPQPDRLTRRQIIPASNAVHRGSLHRTRHRRVHAIGRRNSRPNHRGRLGRLCIGWAATCAAYISMGRSRTLPGQPDLSVIEWSVATFGLLVAVAMMLMKVVPAIPGHFNAYEWLALGVWVALGAIARVAQRRISRGSPYVGIRAFWVPHRFSAAIRFFVHNRLAAALRYEKGKQ